jgi:hypothetical protein
MDIRMSHFKPYDGLEDHAIFGVDPGKISGVALWVPSISHLSIFASAELARDEIAPWLKAQLEHACLIKYDQIRLCMIATENFTQAKGGQPLTSQPDALRVIGVLRTLADQYGCSLTTNGASPAKRLANNDRMRRIGWYKPTKNGHETDARRQILTTAARFHKDLFRDIIKEEEDDATR